MARIGFCGGSYKSQSINADDQVCMGWYPESDESGLGTSSTVLYPTPGLAQFAAAVDGDTVVRGIYFVAYANRLFAVIGAGLYEIFANGTVKKWSVLNKGASDGSVVTMAANNASQLLVCSSGILYLFNLQTNALLVPTADLGPFGSVEFLDGFFVARIANSQEIQISGAEDGTTWNDALVAQISEFTDNIIGMICNQRQLWLMGQMRSVAYYNSGAYPFPLSPIPGSFVENGLGAAASLLRLDNSFFWIGQDERGAGIGWRMNGYTPARITTHAIETAWQSYATLADAIGYSMQDQGHSFACWYFPTANKTWCYDVATQLWHERGFWNEAKGQFTAHRSRCHAYAFGKHLVGDWAGGNIYSLSITNLNDFGNPIRRVRRSPHVSDEQQWMFGQEFQAYVESGLGAIPPLPGDAPIQGFSSLTVPDQNGDAWQVSVADNGQLLSEFLGAGVATYTYVLNTYGTLWQLTVDAATGRLLTTEIQATPYDPQSDFVLISPKSIAWLLLVMADGQLETMSTPPPVRAPRLIFRCSKDGGHTWPIERFLDCGQAGEFSFRAITRRLGRWRNATFEISTTDPIPWRIIDGYLKATPAYTPSERLNKQIAKVQ